MNNATSGQRNSEPGHTQHIQDTAGHIQVAPARAIYMEPFAHIQVVPQDLHEDSEDQSNSPVFRRPSFAQQIRNVEMAGYELGVGTKAGDGPPAVPASLANLTLGTTFAAAARAAELNAVRANKQKAKEAASENEVPEIEPLALGALKFTKSRRGYVRSTFTFLLTSNPHRIPAYVRVGTRCLIARRLPKVGTTMLTTE